MEHTRLKNVTRAQCQSNGKSRIAFAEQFVHVFGKADDNHEDGSESAYQKHGDQNAIDNFQQEVHA